MDVRLLMSKKKNAAAAYIRSECILTSSPETLKKILDTILDPCKKIDTFETIEWIKWLMAGGSSPEEFTSRVRKYDTATTCGLVWTANFVAYRCRTCGISPCMSLCAECFQRGNHKGHDFNMFRSQAGGACDCGDMNVMKESGFCYLHGPHSAKNPHIGSGAGSECGGGAPPELLCVAWAMMPRLILRLIQHMRENSNSLSGFLYGVQEADSFITMLHEMSGMGAAMRQVMTHALTNPQIYKNLTEVEELGESNSPEYFDFMIRSKANYESALKSLPNPTPPEEYKDILALQKDLVHRTFLEEFVFWTAKFEFPQKIVCLLLNLLPDDDYKEAFTRAFVLHYARISQLLVQSSDPDMLSNRVVHVSVQLFSNEKLALRMAEQMGLLHVMVISLRSMMEKITVPSSLGSGSENSHRVVDCGNQCMKDHCYWPLVSDLNNILSHRPVALRFLEDDGLLSMWFGFLSLFQGMNVNQRELHQHVEYEPTTYYAAFSTELEASASPMWALVSHLRDSSTAHLTKNLLRHCKEELKRWFTQIGFNGTNMGEDQVSFHLPLHRFLSVFLYQGVRNQGLSLAELLPHPHDLRIIIQHPLRVQTGFYEIISGLWVRNGLQIKGQAMTYVQCHFCNSMVDADLYLLQVASMSLPHSEFLSLVLSRFNIMSSLQIGDSSSSSSGGNGTRDLEPDHEILMMENCLIFLSSLASIRTAIGVSEGDLVTLEMVTLLCMADKTHSQLMELMPEKCGNSAQSRDFEAVLSRVAEYRAPNFESSGNMLQGMYVPKAFVWEKLYDPIYILLRAIHRRDFQTSLDRFSEYAKSVGKFKGAGTPWPPFRIPEEAEAPYIDPRHILGTKTFHGLLFVIFYKAVNTSQWSDQLLSLAVYLLELSLTITPPIGPSELIACPTHESGSISDDGPPPPSLPSASGGGASGELEVDEKYFDEFTSWYESDSLLVNLRTEIDRIFLRWGRRRRSGSDTPYWEGPDDGEGWGSGEGENEEPMEIDSYELELYEELMEQSGSGLSHDNHPNLALMPPEQGSSGSSSSNSSSLPPSDSLTPLPRLTELSSFMRNIRRVGRSAIDALSPPHPPPDYESQQERGQETSSVLAIKDSVGRKELISRNSSSRKTLGRPIEVNESIITLLLKLHSKLSSAPDSYTPYWETPEAVSLIGDATSGAENGLSLENIVGENYPHAYGPLFYSQLYSVLQLKYPNSRIGDGPFFIGKVLDLMASKDPACRSYITSSKSRLWPPEAEDEEERARREEYEAEERKRRAVERRRQMMEDMKRRQAEFLRKCDESSPGSGGGGESEGREEGEGEGEVRIKPLEYDCVICNQTGPSTASNPIGLVILLQATSVLGHRVRKGEVKERLVTSDEESSWSRRSTTTTKKGGIETMSVVNERRLSLLSQHYEDDGWLMAVSGGWDGGVHVQTCGHHLHHDCLRDYHSSLKTQQRQHNISIDRGEYFCPLCRQLANSFLPLSSEFGIRKSALVKERYSEPQSPLSTSPLLPPSPAASIAIELFRLLREYPSPADHSKMVDSMTKTMEEMTNATSLKYRKLGSSTNTKSILLFVNSIGRTNLELELVLRGGSLVSYREERREERGYKGPSTSASAATSSPMVQSTLPKRSCIVPLLHVLGVHYKILSNVQWLPRQWERVLGIEFLPPPEKESSGGIVATPEHDVPLLLSDHTATLLHLILGLPLHVDSAYFNTIVQSLFNLVLVQGIAVVGGRMGERERERWRGRGEEGLNLEYLLSTVIRAFEESLLLPPDSELNEGAESESESCNESLLLDESGIERGVESLVLPFLRIASLLRSHLYEQELPLISSPSDEFTSLAQFLNLGHPSDPHRSRTTSPASFLSFLSPTPLSVIKTWLSDLLSVRPRPMPPSSLRSLLSLQLGDWAQPTLLPLPHDYDSIFQFYHKRPCSNCHLVPNDPNVCLVCGGIVCLREGCCKSSSSNVFEATQHSLACGAGTAVYLTVNSSMIVVVRGKRACMWGSVYLDSFGEEDRELKRGKPLFLCEERYALLQQQWLTHRFDHSPRKWIFHRDAL